MQYWTLSWKQVRTATNTLKVNQSEKEVLVKNSEMAGYDFGARTVHWVSNQSFALRHLAIARPAKEGNYKNTVERQEKEFHRWTLILCFYGSDRSTIKRNLLHFEINKQPRCICTWTFIWRNFHLLMRTAFFVFCYYLEHR